MLAKAWNNIMFLFYEIDAVIATGISFVYDFMIYAAGAQFFDVEYVRNITTGLYTLIGIFILFYVVIELIKTIMNPDNLLSGEGSVGKIITRIVVTLILIGCVPWVFNIALPQVQQVLIGTAGYNENSTEGKPGLIQSILSEETIEDTKPGLQIAGTLLTAFVNMEQQGEIDSDIEVEGECSDLWTDVNSGGKDVQVFFNNTQKFGKCIKKGEVSYIPLIPTACLVIGIILMVSFLFDIIKVVCELWFLEIISPIPVMMYILPQHTIFDNWLKAIGKSLMKLIIRVASISLLIVAMNTVRQVLEEFSLNFGSLALIIKSILNVILIIGIVMFAKDLPNIISNIFGIDMGGGLNGLGKWGMNKITGLGKGGLNRTLGAVGGGFAAGVAASRASRRSRGGLGVGAFFRGAGTGMGEGWRNSNAEAINIKDGTKLAADEYGGSVRDQRKAEREANSAARKAKSEYDKNTRIASNMLSKKNGRLVYKAGEIKSEDLSKAAKKYMQAKAWEKRAEVKYKAALNTGDADQISIAKEKLENIKSVSDKKKAALQQEMDRTRSSSDREKAKIIIDGSYDKDKIK